MQGPSRASGREGSLRRWAWRFARTALFALGIAVLGVLWLQRDPVSYVLERRGKLHACVEGPELELGVALEQEVRLSSTSGLEVVLLVRRPREQALLARPALVLLGGLRTGHAAARLVEDVQGAVIVGVSYPCELREIRGGLGALPDVFDARQGLIDTPAALMLVMDYLCSLPYVDPGRVELVGVSLGAPFACVAGGLDTRFSRVWSIHGGGAPGRLLERGLADDVSSDFLRGLAARSIQVLCFGSGFAAERWAPRIGPRPFMMVNARDDERIPLECVEVLYAAALEPKELIWIDGGHVDTDESQAVAELCRLVLERVD